MKSKFFVFVSSCIYLLSFMTIYNVKNNEYEYKRINLNLKSIGENALLNPWISIRVINLLKFITIDLSYL